MVLLSFSSVLWQAVLLCCEISVPTPPPHYLKELHFFYTRSLEVPPLLPGKHSTKGVKKASLKYAGRKSDWIGEENYLYSTRLVSKYGSQLSDATRQSEGSGQHHWPLTKPASLELTLDREALQWHQWASGVLGYMWPCCCDSAIPLSCLLVTQGAGKGRCSLEMSAAKQETQCQTAARIVTDLCRQKSLPQLDLETCKEFLLFPDLNGPEPGTVAPVPQGRTLYLFDLHSNYNLRRAFLPHPNNVNLMPMSCLLLYTSLWSPKAGRRCFLQRCIARESEETCWKQVL